MKKYLGPALLLSSLLVATAGCRSVYYSAWEKLGKHKRDLLKENVQEARDDQKAATEQFRDALTRLKEMYRFDGGNLEKTYNALKADFDRSAAKAETVKDRIRKVEQVAADLFAEWEGELGSISSPRLRDDSRSKLQETRRRYEELHSAMSRAERGIGPVLAQFRDQVLYLKHNLNAQAIGALRGESLDIEREIQQLIRDMNASIAQADAFIKALP
ncbi:MAG: DUF2959 domain-containing protein [Verrucomicrobiales bacterium]|nr:DUF2959 domain-containing protein [Verrucomicrobiales bacterium]